MPVPLYEAKAEFFRMLGHPVRIRVLELLQDGPKPVRDLLAAIEVEPSNLSQQLAVLRRSGIVRATRTGSTVVYELAGGDVGRTAGSGASDPGCSFDGPHGPAGGVASHGANQVREGKPVPPVVSSAVRAVTEYVPPWLRRSNSGLERA